MDDNGNIVRHIDEIDLGNQLNTILADGEIVSEVSEVKPNNRFKK